MWAAAITLVAVVGAARPAADVVERDRRSGASARPRPPDGAGMIGIGIGDHRIGVRGGTRTIGGDDRGMQPIAIARLEEQA
jgi:hypothetical protein